MTDNTTSLADLAGTDLGSRTVNYTERDAILYALAIGAAATDLDLVYERDLRVLPTYALALGLWAVEAAGDLGAYDRLKSLHATQRLQVHAPLPPVGKLGMTARVANVWDKGKAAMLDIDVTCEQFTATYSIFVPGMGGWGGERGAAAATYNDSGVQPLELNLPTSVDLAALYRLTGDRHPVHIDPDTAAGYGFPRPILHGLCTLGVAALGVARAAGAHPCDLDVLEARFAAPVYPGDRLGLQARLDAGAATFEVRVDDRPVLTNGYARFRSDR